MPSHRSPTAAPRSTLALFPLVVLAGCTPSPARVAHDRIRYDVRIDRPEDRLFEITMRIHSDRDRLVLRLPATTPGDVGFKQHARYLDHFHASREDGAPLDYMRTGAQSWEVRTPFDSETVVQYRIHANERDVLRLGTNSLDAHGGFLEGASAFLYADRHMSDSVEVHYTLPAGWTLVTTLPGTAAGAFVADGYQSLVDASVQFGGEMDERTLPGDAPVRIVFDRPLPPYDHAAFDRNVAAIARTVASYYDSTPFSDYTIFAHWRPDLDYGGGLEHGRAMVLNIGSQWMLDLPVNAAGTIAHEMFHAWNGEAFHPQELDRWDFAGPDYSPHLWFIEGVTSYFADLTMIRSGILPESTFFAAMSRVISAYENDPGRGWQSLAESSVSTWTFPPDAMDYYGGGEAVGFLLDMTLRLDTGGERGLVDVLRRLYAQSRRPGYRGYDDADLRAVVDSVAGHDTGAFFDRYVTGRDHVDYGPLLERAGLSLAVTHSPAGEAQFHIEPLEHQTAAQRRIWHALLHDDTAEGRASGS